MTTISQHSSSTSRSGRTGREVGRRVDGDVNWLDTVAGGLPTEAARSAAQSGDTSNDELTTAVRGVLEAEVRRGG